MNRFPMERWLEEHDGAARWDVSRSGYHPKTLRELVGTGALLDTILDTPQRYTPNNGGAALRDVIATQWPGCEGDSVLVTSGATESNWLAIDTLIRPGDEFVSIEPAYQQAPLAAVAHGATVRRLSGTEAGGWRPDLDELATLVTERTRMIYVCQPANPSGICLTESEIDGIVAAAERVGAWVLADEIYRGTEHSTNQWSPTFAGRSDRVIVTGSLSKTYGLPGMRTGWLLAAPELVRDAADTREYINAWQTRPADEITALVLAPDRREVLVAAYRQRLAGHLPILLDWVSAQHGRARLVSPEATAVGFIHLDLPDAPDSFAIANRLREEASVLVVPGGLFGGTDAGHVRVTYGVEPEELSAALAAIAELLQRTDSTQGEK